jgi:hypothetical protein
MTPPDGCDGREQRSTDENQTPDDELDDEPDETQSTRR